MNNGEPVTQYCIPHKKIDEKQAQRNAAISFNSVLYVESRAALILLFRFYDYDEMEPKLT